MKSKRYLELEQGELQMRQTRKMEREKRERQAQRMSRSNRVLDRQKQKAEAAVEHHKRQVFLERMYEEIDRLKLDVPMKRRTA